MSAKTVRILSFDPSITNLGWALIEYNIRTGKGVVLKYGLLKGDVIAREMKKRMLPEFSKQYTILCAIKDAVALLTTELQPDYVANEGAFSHRFVKAFASLTLVIHQIRSAVHLVMNRNIYQVQPTEVKLAISNKGTASKDEVKKAVLEHEDLSVKASKQHNIEDASEHEFDAIAVGWAFIKIQLPAILAEAALMAEAVVDFDAVRGARASKKSKAA